MRVLKSHPKSALLYIQLWNKKGKQMRFIIKKTDIRKEYLMSPTMFRNLLSPLMFLNLVNFFECEVDGKFRIDILGHNLNE